MASLAEKEGLKGKIQMIYMDLTVLILSRRPRRVPRRIVILAAFLLRLNSSLMVLCSFSAR